MDLKTTPSYGAIVFEKLNGHFYCLVTGSRRGISFPKGHQEDGEKPIETAHREVLEETGLDVEVDTSFAGTVSSEREGDHRTVTFFLGSCYGKMPTPTPQLKEVRFARWLPIEEIPPQMRFESDLRVFMNALKAKGITIEESKL